MLQLSTSHSKTRDISPQLLYVSSAQLQFNAPIGVQSWSADLQFVSSADTIPVNFKLSPQRRIARAQPRPRSRPGSDPGQTWTRFKPSMTASLNEDLEKQLYHDLTQGREDIEDVTNDPNRQPQQDMVEFLKEAEDAIRSFMLHRQTKWIWDI
ncbi:MAG: hypothetical protein FRX49_11148 [Trebouxia sp. A1-2]|nr:MAG: hypothetical protein FRX49_11148 [Trebouxia sp. A1-2]